MQCASYLPQRRMAFYTALQRGRAASGPTGARGGRAMASRGTDAGAVGMDDAPLSLSRLLEPEVRRGAYPLSCRLRDAAPVRAGESAAGAGRASVVTRAA